MKTFKEFLMEQRDLDQPEVVIVQLPSTLLEYKEYKNIPGTNRSYREDPANTNTKTQQHVHVYAKPKGKGKEIYSANKDGSGHDGSSGKEIPKRHADYFREKGYDIKPSNILEFVEIDNASNFTFFILIETL